MLPPELLNTIECADALDYLRRLPDACVDAVVTDPPYNMTELAFEQAIDWSVWWKQVQRVRRNKHTPIVLFSQQPFTTDLILSNRKEWRYELIWEKSLAQGNLDSKRRPLRAHENIQVFGAAMPTYYPVKTPALEMRARSRRGSSSSKQYGDHGGNVWTDDGTRYPRSVMKYAQRNTAFSNTKTHHPTEKPVLLMEWLLKLFTKSGDVVLDCFAGSGSTAMAARKLYRCYIGCDVDQQWVDVALQRLRRSDPYQHREVTNNVVQLSLMAMQP